MSLFVPLGFREAFSLLPSCLCGFIWSNTVEFGGFRKEVCYSDESQYPYEGFCGSLSHLCHGKGMCFPIHPNCYNVWTESFRTIPTDFLGSPNFYNCSKNIADSNYTKYSTHYQSTFEDIFDISRWSLDKARRDNSIGFIKLAHILFPLQTVHQSLCLRIT